MDTALPPTTHNNPPDPIAERMAALEQTHTDLLARQAELLGMEERLPAECTDGDWEGKLINAIKACTTYTKNSEATRLSANEPYRALIGATDGFFKTGSDKVDNLKKKMSAMLTAYQKKQEEAERRRLQAIADEEKRIAAEAKRKADEEARLVREAKAEEERIAAEARAAAEKLAGAARRKAEAEEAERAAIAAAAQREQEEKARIARDEAKKAEQAKNVAKVDANAKAADLSRARTTEGAKASLKVTWEFTVENAALVPREFCEVDESAIRVAVKAATTKDNKNNLKIPGVKIYPKSDSIVR